MNPQIMLYAFRYACGRMTYAVDDVATEIEKQVKDLPIKALYIMIGEIKDRKFTDTLGGGNG